ncbi:hypothetical protein Tco_0632364 [Tanacetum coccineum]
MLRTCYGHGLTKATIIQIFYHGLDNPTQGILDAGGIFLYNTPNKAFKILEDNVLLKLDFSDDSQNNPKPERVVSAGGSNIDSYHLKEMRDGLRDNHASQIYMKDDTPMCDPYEANYVVELERQIDQGLRNRLAIIENLERQFEYLVKILQTESLPRTIDSKTRHEFVYKPPSIRNENDKGDVAAIEEDAINPIPTMPNPNLIKYNSPFLKNSTVHIPYTNAKTFADDVLLNNVGDKELKSIDDVGNGVLTKKEIKKDKMGMLKEHNKEWKLNEKVVPHNEEVYHYQLHPTEIPHLNHIIKES